MTIVSQDKIPIQNVLVKVCKELTCLSERLRDVEALLFDSGASDGSDQKLVKIQDIDLIIQQISDLSRALKCVAEVEMDDAMVRTGVFGDNMHLNDLRLRLLGISHDSATIPVHGEADVTFF